MVGTLAEYHTLCLLLTHMTLLPGGKEETEVLLLSPTKKIWAGMLLFVGLEHCMRSLFFVENGGRVSDEFV